MLTRLVRNVAIASLALTFTACGDSTAPNLELTEDQVADMMDALSAAGLAGFGTTPEASLAVVSYDGTVDCPNGGTASINATINENDAGTSVTLTFTQGFSNCKATSSQGRLWTFNGNPNIVTNFSGTFNEETGDFTLNGSQTGGITASSDLGSGACAWNVEYTMSGNDNTGAFSGNVSGTICGRNISQSVTVE